MGRDTVAPHAAGLVDLVVEPARREELRASSLGWPSWRLTLRQLCDVELLANGGFTPLQGFLGPDDYAAVCESMRLANGRLWPIPITLDLPEDTVRAAEHAGSLALRDPEGAMVAVLHLTHAWRPDLRAEAAAVFGTLNEAHPGVQYLLRRTNQ